MELNKFFEKTKLPFLVAFEVMLLLRTINIYSLLPSKLDSLVFGLLSVWAALYIANKLFFSIKNKQFNYFDPLLIIFLAMIFLSIVVHYETYLVANMKLWLWQAIYLLVIYQIGKERNRKTFAILETILLVSWFILVVIAIAMFLAQYTYSAPLDKIYNGLRVGFYENRLYGLFSDPNFAATISVVSIILSVHLVLKKVAKKWTILLVINVILQWIYVVLSGSRTAYVELFVVAFVGIFFIAYKKWSPKGFFIGVLYAAFSSVIFVVGIYLFTILIEKGMLYALDLLRSMKSHNVPDVTLDRPDVENKSDISNNRFGLWKSSFEIFKSSMWFGTSPRNLVTYAQNVLPNTLIAIKQQTSHNFFFYLLATTGLAGTIPLTMFLINKIFNTVKALFTPKVNIFDNYLLRDTLIALTILVSAFFLTELILVNKIGTFLFWFYLGSVSSAINKKSEI
ncbi:hypothetical protein A5821_001481 [Enterococcus sp. 7F3_DIV0205]|uniref:O-antigen ligase-related domain-containing protein n=1 Tax=Candidatus Enterococcus palustris TaxID=1834189 RepID=A0AAQ3Y7A5_9ENTE|nr:O-antigen ligase family protein [Enterococcus sp. 7F3_DIV0205]OTN85877.1 hypothetical protein A5821_001825 [Enterococcus sp. 7F3_DIV0205]